MSKMIFRVTECERLYILRSKIINKNAFCRKYNKLVPNTKCEKLSSKRIRDLFLDYFIKEKSHTYIHSSPVFLNNDPTLLFVNAGMNQFRSLLLNKMQPDYPFFKLHRVANSQKCIRLSGKHNDLDDVGRDLHHHTFFEMLGNWSFGDYSKKEACEMAWELLTKVYNLNPENLYITYFGGCEEMGVPADEECKNIWLDIGIPSNHIFPFGKKDNFWEMADVGPCGPCTEIHYDFLNSSSTAAARINADKPDLIEIWNLVFIQYNREQNGSLKSIPSLNVDTGMGFERLTAVLQGTMSNYDTDIFIPLFKAIEKNFNARPYGGKTGSEDVDGFDTAYRVLADHSRMFSVAIADGLFPDNYDAGHILRKIIRRASYAANKVMKTRPGTLSSIVPVVAESLDFYPEVVKNVKEIVEIINEEEKLFHHLINRGRKARNKMMADNPSKILNGQQVWHLNKSYGLDEVVLRDIASEVNLDADWEGFQKFHEEKKEFEKKQFQNKIDEFSNIIKVFQDKDIPATNDLFKYNYCTDKNKYGVENLFATVVGIIKNNELVTNIEEGNQCYVVTDKTNFYSEAGGQIADNGEIFNEDFTFQVNNVVSSRGYVFHYGTVLKGAISCGHSTEMKVNWDHRLACTQNHTATHLLNSTLRNILRYTSQRSSYVGSSYLKLGFSARSALTDEEIETIENNINKVIKQNMTVSRIEMPFEELLGNPKAVILRGEQYPEYVSVISVGDTKSNEILSVEPCCGTHVHNTSDIEQFIIIPSKNHGGSTRILSAATGKQASILLKNGKDVFDKVLQLKNKVNDVPMMSNEILKSLLKEVNHTLRECQMKQDAPLRVLNECEKALQELKLKLNDMLTSYNINENMVSGVTEDSKTKHKISDKIIQLFLSRNIPFTNDNFKYKWNGKTVDTIEADIIGIVRDDELVECVQRGLDCQLLLDKTNFYAEEDDQAGDEGIISCKDFVFKVNSVHKVNGFVLHDGYVEDGSVTQKKTVNLIVDDKHRLSCSQNHTALHLLNAALQVELPYAYQLQAYAGPKELSLIFSSKFSLSDSQVSNIERKINESVKANSYVKKSKIPIKSLNNFPTYKLPIVKKSVDTVPTVSIGEEDAKMVLRSVEPCFGTHVDSTADIGSFIILTSKSKNNKEKVIRAVTGEQAEVVKRYGEVYEKEMLQLEEYLLSCLEKDHLDYLELWDCLKEVKCAKVYHETDLPLLLFREHQNKLSDLSKRLTEATHNFVQQGFKMVASEMKKLLNEGSDKPFIVYKLESIGDGKKIINYALDNSKNKPAMYFARDGHKSFICSCSVPEHLVHSSFSALLWINPVASLLEGKARTLPKNQELTYSVICTNSNNLDKAID